jgi:hypothetical protein
MDDPEDLLKKYKAQLAIDTELDIINVLDKAYSLPSIRHKWNGLFHDAKTDLYRLVQLKEAYIDGVMLKDNPMQLSRTAIVGKILHQKQYKELLNKIFHQETLVEYIRDSIKDNISKMGYDIKNIIELKKEDHIS